MRSFPHGTYTPATNAFSDYAVVDFDGSVTELGPIPFVDATDADQTIQGTRTTNIIKVTGFGLDLKVAVEENNQQPLIQDSILVYRLLGVYDDWNNPVAEGDPTINELIKWYRFGYSPLLDYSPIPSQDRRKIKTFMKGKVFLKGNDAFPRDQSVSRYVKLENPLTVQYNNTTGDENVPHRWRFYLAVRSNIPVATGDVAKENIKPRLASAAKVYYWQP